MVKACQALCIWETRREAKEKEEETEERKIGRMWRNGDGQEGGKGRGGEGGQRAQKNTVLGVKPNQSPQDASRYLERSSP